jgi:hypothetical protein
VIDIPLLPLPCKIAGGWSRSELGSKQLNPIECYGPHEAKPPTTRALAAQPHLTVRPGVPLGIATRGPRIDSDPIDIMGRLGGKLNRPKALERFKPL